MTVMPSYHTSVIKYHSNFSWLCRAIGIPCLAAEVCSTYKYSTATQGFLLSAVATFITSLKTRHKEQVTGLVNAVSVLAILGLSVTDGNYMHVAASILFIISGLVGSEGDVKVIKMARVNVLHYVLVAVNYCIVWGFAQ
ncbi:hypothetical protein Hamer_G013978 [Homarus americanus]|uniref:Uncharacterized protein n=1 Tax=Homarus americanus TaxID=6706 RepID=A0A8J5MRK7_HOMAM|nr:hypothetical protein Hamer_G013978 [Homarus americanus]